jgi:hypothetical protein
VPCLRKPAFGGGGQRGVRRADRAGRVGRRVPACRHQGHGAVTWRGCARAQTPGPGAVMPRIWTDKGISLLHIAK